MSRAECRGFNVEGSGLWFETAQRGQVELAGEVFVDRFAPAEWYVRALASGQYQAHALVHVDRGTLEVLRAAARGEREARLERVAARYQETLQAYERYQSLLTAGRLEEAWAQARDVRRAYERTQALPDFQSALAHIVAKGWLFPIPLSQLDASTLLDGVSVIAKPIRPVRTGAPVPISLYAEREGRAVAGVTLEVSLPAGPVGTVRLGPDGRGEIRLPPPAHPGRFPMVSRWTPESPTGTPLPERPFSPSWTTELLVTGPSLEGAGFDWYTGTLESYGVGTLDETPLQNRRTAERLAIEAARTEAYGRLAQELNGLSVSRTSSVRRGYFQSSQTTAEAAAFVRRAETVRETVDWEQGRPVATVVLRVPRVAR